MGSKIEKILFIAILIVSVIPFFFKINDFESKDRVIQSTKSSEIVDFTEYDINKSSLKLTLVSTLAEEKNNLWYLTKPKITNDEIKSLTSKRAISRGKKIEFIDNVKLYKKDGKKYFSQRAIYDTVTKVIVTPDNFLISKEYDLVRGINMEYDTQKQETKAKNVKGTFILKNR